MDSVSDEDLIYRLEEQRINILTRAKALIPIMNEARASILQRGENVSNERLASYLSENGIEPLFGTRWYSASVGQTMGVEQHQRALSKRILALKGAHSAEARDEHDREIVEAREIGFMLR